MNILLFKQLEHEICDIDFEIAEIADEIANVNDDDDDLDVNTLVERRQQLEHRRARLQMQLVHLMAQR